MIPVHLGKYGDSCEPCASREYGDSGKSGDSVLSYTFDEYADSDDLIILVYQIHQIHLVKQVNFLPTSTYFYWLFRLVIVIVIFNLHNPSFREQICSNFIEKSGYQVQWAIQTLIQRHPKTALCWIQSYLYASVSNTDPLRIAQYTTLCTFLRKNWNLEFEIHGNWFFSFFLRVVSLEKKCLFPTYFWGFFKISPGANNPEEFLFNKQHIVQWGRDASLSRLQQIIQ